MRVLLALLLLAATPAYASAPLPPKKDASLDSLKQKVEAEKKRQQELDRQSQDLKRDLGGIKDNLVRTAAKIQRSEAGLQKLESELAALKQKKSDLVSSLQSDRESLASLIVALERIRRLPPETLLARPGAPRDTAQAATALGAILPELNKRAEDLRVKLEELGKVETELTASQETLKAAYDALKTEKGKMDFLLASRSKAWTQTQSDLKQQQQAVATASKEASDFEELIARIEQKNRALQAEKEKQQRQAEPSRLLGRKLPDASANVPLPGNAQLPVSGIVRVRYGEPDAIGAPSEGLRIESRSAAVVVAPMGGIVRYAGEFKSYGNIVLLEHKNNYHSLIAGLGRIDTVVGQSVDSGEPVGSLGAQAGERPVLYYELRLNGKPVNPARKFSDLGT